MTLFADLSRSRISVFASSRANKVAKWRTGFTDEGFDYSLTDERKNENICFNLDITIDEFMAF